MFAVSGSFTISPATASETISAYYGDGQSAPVNGAYGSPLQALVTDNFGNALANVAVTFTAPASGPSVIFNGSNGSATATTGPNGIATSPNITANSTSGSIQVMATTAGAVTPALFNLTNVAAAANRLAFVQQPTDTAAGAPPGQTVQVTAPGGWTANSSTPWLSVQPTSGSGTAQITVSVNPAGLAAGTYTGFISVFDSSGDIALVLVTYTVGNRPTLVIAPPRLTFVTTSNTITPSVQMLQASSSSRAIAYTVAAQVSTPAGGAWLQVSPLQGTTVGTVTVSVNPDGLSDGIYAGLILFTPTDTTINAVAVPVTLIVGCQQGGCTLQPTILAITNAASFHVSGAPAAAMTIFGTNLSDAIYQAQTYPLPAALGPTSVTVNGIAAPLYYASPTQIDFQMPSGVPAADVNVLVTNSALTRQPFGVRASVPRTFRLSDVDPGLFITTSGRAAALNVDLSPNTPTNPVPGGGYILLFITGQGPVTPAVADGTAAPASPLSIMNGRAQVFVGGVSAQVTYQGLAPGFAGLAQINAIVPSGLVPGDQPVFVTVNGVASNAGTISVK